MKKYSLAALVAAGLLAGGLSAGSASAADLGGNCCADLEERVAELEATTARKGNRKVSLTVSGWVAEQVVWWDDGAEQNMYVSGIGSTLSSHFKFTGQATISPGWYAGYVIQVETNTTGTLGGQNQDSDEGQSGLGLNTLQSFWFIKSDTYGKLGVGLQSQASDNTAILVDGSGSLVPANWVMFEGAGFFLNVNGVRQDYKWGDVLQCRSINAGIGGDCNGATNNVVRYDTPVFGGFSASASWGEDDMWDVAARYAGEHAGFKVAAAVAYNEYTDFNNVSGTTGYTITKEAKYFQAGVYIEHVPTGVFVYGAYGQEEATSINAIAIPDAETYYFKAGLRERWTPLGHTVLYGEYMKKDDGLGDALLNDGFTNSEFTLWGAGIVQEIDAAAMSLWVSYRHFEGEAGTANTKVDFDDFDLIKAGALINF